MVRERGDQVAEEAVKDIFYDGRTADVLDVLYCARRADLARYVIALDKRCEELQVYFEHVREAHVLKQPLPDTGPIAK